MCVCVWAPVVCTTSMYNIRYLGRLWHYEYKYIYVSCFVAYTEIHLHQHSIKTWTNSMPNSMRIIQKYAVRNDRQDIVYIGTYLHRHVDWNVSDVEWFFYQLIEYFINSIIKTYVIPGWYLFRTLIMYDELYSFYFDTFRLPLVLFLFDMKWKWSSKEKATS